MTLLQSSRKPVRVRPPEGCNIDVLRELGHVVEHQDGTVTITPESRSKDLMLDGLLAYWKVHR